METALFIFDEGSGDTTNTIYLGNSYLQSDNYVQGQSGWMISPSGDAEFQNILIRGDLSSNGTGAQSFAATSSGTYFGDLSGGYFRVSQSNVAQGNSIVANYSGNYDSSFWRINDNGLSYMWFSNLYGSKAYMDSNGGFVSITTNGIGLSVSNTVGSTPGCEVCYNGIKLGKNYDGDLDSSFLWQSSGLMKLDSSLIVSKVSNYANNAAALAGGLTTGTLYRNGDVVQIVH